MDIVPATSPASSNPTPVADVDKDGHGDKGNPSFTVTASTEAQAPPLHVLEYYDPQKKVNPFHPFPLNVGSYSFLVLQTCCRVQPAADDELCISSTKVISLALYSL